MKNIFSVVFFSLLMFCCIMPAKLIAADQDTLVIYASDSRSLDEIIVSDTTSSGTRNHKGYKLVSIDTTYLYLGPITVNTDLTVIGQPAENGKLPVIQPGNLSDGSMPEKLFVLTGEGTIGTFKNFYVYGKTIGGDWNWGKAFLLNADNINFYMDNVIVEENRGEIVAYSGKGSSFYITNCKFRNGVYPGNQFSSVVLTSDYPTANPADTIIMNNNTMFCISASAASPGVNAPTNYFEFSHNSVIFSFTGVFRIFNVIDAKIENNLFYGVFAGMEKIKVEYPAWYESFSYEWGSVISIDTMTVADNILFNPADSEKPDWRMLTEAKRKVVVQNNVYYLPQEITNYWNEWNNTQPEDYQVYLNKWMNDRTKNMFADKTHWPGFLEANNIIDVDPGFGSDFKNVLLGGDGYGVGLLKYAGLTRNGTILGEDWGYKMQLPEGDYWVPAWPLAETQDMKYTNSSVKNNSNDGLPVGDPSWFGVAPTGVEDSPVQIVGEFKLFEAYPNPFNPSTTIKFSLAKAGNFSLKVYNVTGELVKVLADNVSKEAGEYQYSLSMSNFSSGVYFYTLSQGGMQITKKLVLMK